MGHASWSTKKAVAIGKQAAKVVMPGWEVQNVNDKTSVLPMVEIVVQLNQLQQVGKLLSAKFSPPDKQINLSP